MTTAVRLIRVGLLAGVLTFALMLSPEPAKAPPSFTLASTPSSAPAGFALSQEQHPARDQTGTKASGG